MREPQKRTIEGVTFEVTPLGFKRGRRAFVRLSKAIGPALGAADSVDALRQGRGVTEVLEKLLDSVSDEDLEWFADVLGKGTRFSRDGDKWPFLNESNRDALFGGELVLFFRWLMFALEVNFSDFLELFKSGKTASDPSPQKEESRGED